MTTIIERRSARKIGVELWSETGWAEVNYAITPSTPISTFASFEKEKGGSFAVSEAKNDTLINFRRLGFSIRRPTKRRRVERNRRRRERL
jgi:hypothetical protein